MTKIVNEIKKLILASICFYQKYLSFDNGLARGLFVTDKVCRFQPSCSQYTYQAIAKYGILLGVWKGLRRIVRCHPWSKGGFNPLR
jgi:putative membrane protein insertion efficiency factor